jgi:hypothetical protein
MNAREAIRQNMDMTHTICQSYLSDLTDSELLVRPVPASNHTAWQLGHLLVSEHEMVETAFPGSMPALPPGFQEKYTPDTSKLDSPSAFHPKSVYMAVYEQQRAGTLKALDKLSDADLDKPGPEKFKDFLKTVGELFNMQGTHWMMHAGQWAVTRRKLGRKPLF